MNFFDIYACCNIWRLLLSMFLQTNTKNKVEFERRKDRKRHRASFMLFDSLREITSSKYRACAMLDFGNEINSSSKQKI